MPRETTAPATECTTERAPCRAHLHADSGIPAFAGPSSSHGPRAQGAAQRSNNRMWRRPSVYGAPPCKF
eukprot:2840203-Prymnesium_polylepis.2